MEKGLEVQTLLLKAVGVAEATRWKRMITAEEWADFFSVLKTEAGDLPFVKIRDRLKQSGFQAAWRAGELRYWVAVSGSTARVLYSSRKTDELPAEIREWAEARGAREWRLLGLLSSVAREVDLSDLSGSGLKERILVRLDKKTRLRGWSFEFATGSARTRNWRGPSGVMEWSGLFRSHGWRFVVRDLWIAREKGEIIGVVILLGDRVLPLWGEPDVLAALLGEGVKQARLWGYRKLRIPEGLL